MYIYMIYGTRYHSGIIMVSYMQCFTWSQQDQSAMVLAKEAINPQDVLVGCSLDVDRW